MSISLPLAAITSTTDAISILEGVVAKLKELPPNVPLTVTVIKFQAMQLADIKFEVDNTP